MAKIKSIKSDPRWHEFVKKYRHNWISASIILFGFYPSQQQRELLGHAKDPTILLSISSGHGTGKSSQIAIVTILYMLCYPDAMVNLVANKIDQVKAAVYKNIRVYWNKLIRVHPWIENYFELTSEAFYEKAGKGVWQLSAKSCRQGNEESLAGCHNKYMLWIVDEASGISDKAFGIMSGSMTEECNSMILMSQPTRDSGFFYRTHNDPALAQSWIRLVFSSEDSPHVTNAALVKLFLQFGCDRESPEYLVKVRGLFPKSLKGYLLSADDIKKATKAKPKLSEDWGWIMTVDVGNTRDSSVININKVSGDGDDRRVINKVVHEFSGTIDPVDLAPEIINLVNCGDYPNITVAIDSDGIGSSTAKLVEREGIPVYRIHWGEPMFTSEDKKLYLNKRAYAHVMCRNAARTGRIRFDRSPKTQLQGSRLPYSLDERGRYCMMPKQKMREQNIPSPDRFDTYCFVFLCDYISANMVTDERVLEAREQANDWTRELAILDEIA